MWVRLRADGPEGVLKGRAGIVGVRVPRIYSIGSIPAVAAVVTLPPLWVGTGRRMGRWYTFVSSLGFSPEARQARCTDAFQHGRAQQTKHQKPDRARV
jgi:hypothetical protein